MKLKWNGGIGVKYPILHTTLYTCSLHSTLNTIHHTWTVHCTHYTLLFTLVLYTLYSIQYRLYCLLRAMCQLFCKISKLQADWLHQLHMCGSMHSAHCCFLEFHPKLKFGQPGCCQKGISFWDCRKQALNVADRVSSWEKHPIHLKMTVLQRNVIYWTSTLHCLCPEFHPKEEVASMTPGPRSSWVSL